MKPNEFDDEFDYEVELDLICKNCKDDKCDAEKCAKCYEQMKDEIYKTQQLDIMESKGAFNE